MYYGSQRYLAQEQSVSDFGGYACAAHDRLAYLKAVRSEDIALLAVGVHHQSDACRTVRVVLDSLYSCGNTVLRALEVDVTIHLLVTSADIAHGHLTRIVTSARALLGTEQRLFRRRASDLVKSAYDLMSRTGCYRLKLSYCHVC